MRTERRATLQPLSAKLARVTMMLPTGMLYVSILYIHLYLGDIHNICHYRSHPSHFMPSPQHS